MFQPIVTLPDGVTVAYEALIRGPRDTPFERPDELFAAARAEGSLAELDFHCQAQALRTATACGLARPYKLFINVEPDVSDPMPDWLRGLYAGTAVHLDVMVEVTERALTAHPAALLGRVNDLRSLGCSIAVDDVGADERSLAMMAFLKPEVIKLDMSFVQSRPGERTAAIAHAVNSEAERGDAAVLVEGVEEPAHADAGVALGATLAQGWHFGRPGPLPAAPPAPVPELALRAARREVVPPTPWELVAQLPRTRVSAKRLLYSMTRHLEREAVRLGGTAVLLSTFESAEMMTALTRERYGLIAEHVGFCGALAADLEGEPAPGVRGACLARRDPLAREWNVAVISPHFAAALIGYDMGDTGADAERRFRYLLTYDRTIAVAAARSMMARLVSP